MKNTIIKSLCRVAKIIIVPDLRHISAVIMQSSKDNYSSRLTSHISCTPKQGQQVPMIAIRLT